MYIYGSNYINNLFDTSTSDLSSLTKINTSSLTLNSVTNSSFSLPSPSTLLRFFHLVFTPISGSCYINVSFKFAYALSYGIASLNSSGVLTSSQLPTLTLASNISDCSISSPSNNQVLQYNSSSSKWVNSTLSLITALASLSDCQISSPVGNQALIYIIREWVSAYVHTKQKC